MVRTPRLRSPRHSQLYHDTKPTDVAWEIRALMTNNVDKNPIHAARAIRALLTNHTHPKPAQVARQLRACPLTMFIRNPLIARLMPLTDIASSIPTCSTLHRSTGEIRP